MLQLIDLAGIYFRAHFAMPSSMKTASGFPHGALRGSVDMLARVIELAQPAQVVTCLDVDWRPAWRVALLPSYKAQRVDPTAGSTPTVVSPKSQWAEVIPEALIQQVPVLYEVLDAVGLCRAGAAELEADDVIGAICAAESTSPIEVVTGDRDLFQVIRTAPTPVTVRYIGAGMNKSFVLDTKGLQERHGIDGAGYVLFSALRGDPSDGLPGVPGIGEKTASRLAQRYSTADELLDAAASDSPDLTVRLRANITDAADYLSAAIPVVRVRTDIAPPLDGDPAVRREPADPDRLRQLSEQYDLHRPVERLVAALHSAATANH